jgi:hypothetical protein
MASSSSPLNFVDESGHGVNSTMIGLRSKLQHQEEIAAFDIHVDPFSDDLFKQFANALHECYRSVCFGDAIIRFLWFVNNYYGCLFPQVYTLSKASVEEVWDGGGICLMCPF